MLSARGGDGGERIGGIVSAGHPQRRRVGVAGEMDLEAAPVKEAPRSPSPASTCSPKIEAGRSSASSRRQDDFEIVRRSALTTATRLGREIAEQAVQFSQALVVEADVGDDRNVGLVKDDRPVAFIDFADIGRGIADERAGEGFDRRRNCALPRRSSRWD